MTFPIGLKRSAAMVALRHEDRFMLLRRAKAPNAGRYVPIGGKLEPYEDPYSAALRETREETGLVLDDLRYGGVLIETSPTDYNWQGNIYLADIPDMPPPPCDEGILEWVAFADIPTLPAPPTDWHVYQFLVAGRPFALNAIYDERLDLVRMVEEISGEVLV
jgi:8-oxo-dGTP diphosphatase